MMMEQILERENMLKAWQRVKSNAGAPGMDGMTVGEFPEFIREHWPRIRSALMEGTYCPAPVRRVFIPKPDGTQRPLGVPTVLDRLIQQAMAQVLTPLFEGGFSTHSYGFREGRSAHQAVREMEACWPTSRSTHWTAPEGHSPTRSGRERAWRASTNSKGADIVLPATPTTFLSW
jgi:RNA-directed DNA polymerase